LQADRKYIVGREPTADVVVENAGVSRRHFELAHVGQHFIVRDLDSLNGTFVNGQRISVSPLNHGDIIRLGERLGVVFASSDQSAPHAVQEIAKGCWAGPTLRRALHPARVVAKSDLPIVLQGATGTGKERAARAIHEWSRRSGAFVPLNCAAIPEQLAEAELFGHRKGAFTGADSARVGHLRSADGGTLFLDEISDLPLPLQAKLLRVVEQNEVQPVGETRHVAIDVRVLVASQVSLAEQVVNARFRADLHARLNGLTISLPSLNSRREEIPSLFVQLLKTRLGASPPPIEPQLIERLMLHEWTGNVRELELFARRLLGLHGHEPKLLLSHLRGSALGMDDEPAQPPAPKDAVLSPAHRNQRDLERLLNSLRDSGGNLTQAASLAGISRQRAYRLLEDHAKVDLESLRKGALQ
jgi:DNA-binding NtrC family response regulator